MCCVSYHSNQKNVANMYINASLKKLLFLEIISFVTRLVFSNRWWYVGVNILFIYYTFLRSLLAVNSKREMFVHDISDISLAKFLHITRHYCICSSHFFRFIPIVRTFFTPIIKKWLIHYVRNISIFVVPITSKLLLA